MTKRTLKMTSPPEKPLRPDTTIGLQLRELFLDGIRRDNRSAYEDFLEQAGRLIRAFLSRRLPLSIGRGEAILEDLVQDVLIAVHTKRHTYREDHPVLPWLYAIARHRTIDYLRMMKARPQTISFFEEEEDNLERITHEASLVLYRAELATQAEQERHENLLEQMESLTPQQREILQLAKLEERPLQEIADRMELSLSAVKVTVHRAIQKLARANAPRKDKK